MDENNSSKQSTNSDYFILIVGFVIILVAGVASVRWFPQAILTSFFCGLVASTIIYRFLGGFSKEDSFVWNGTKFTGALGALLAVTLLINQELTQQIQMWTSQWNLELSPPNYEKLLVIDSDGNIQNLVAKVSNREDMKISIKPKKEQLYKFVEFCLSEPGVCLPEPKPVSIKVKTTLSRGEGEVCGNRSIYSGLPISLRRGSENFVSVYIKQNRDQSCNDSHDTTLHLNLSCEDNKELSRVPTRVGTTYELGPFRKPTDQPIKSRETSCSA